MSTLLLLWAGIAKVISEDHEHTTAAAVKENENLALAFEEHVASSIGGLDQLIQLVRLQYVQKSKQFDLPTLLQGISVPPSVIQMAIIDEHGYLAHSSLPFERLDLSDREHYLVHRDRDSGTVFISKPVLGRLSGKWSLQLSRRITNSDGTFGGAVVLSLDPRHFVDFYRQVNLGGNGIVVFVGLDGVIRARHNRNEFTPGLDMRSLTLFKRLSVSDHGSFLTKGSIDGVSRYVSYRTMGQYPFVVMAGVAKEEVLSVFYERRAYLLSIAVVVTLVLAAAAVWLLRMAERQARYLAESVSSRARLLTFMDSVPDIAWMKDHEGRFIAINRAFANRFAMEPREIVGRTEQELPGEPIALSSAIEHQRVMASGRVLRLETAMDRSGDVRWFETIEVPVYGDGKVRGTSGVSRDITDRKRVEDALVESERRLKLALDGADVALFDWNIATGDVFISDRWSAFVGGTPGPTRTTLEALRQQLHPEDLPVLNQHVIAALKHDGRYQAEHRVRAEDGRWIWIESHGSVVSRDPAGRAVRMLGINADITRRKQIEYNLRASEERFRNLTELSSDWYWEQDAEFRYTRISGGFAERAGLRPEDYLGRRCWELPGLRSSSGQLAEHRAVLERRDEFYDCEMQHVEAAGEVRYWSLSGKPRFDDAGRYCGYLGVGRDITQRKIAELALRDAYAFVDSVVDNIPLVVFVKDIDDFRYVRVNKAAECLLDRARETLIGRNDRDLFPAQEAEYFTRTDRLAMEKNGLIEIPEYRIRTPGQGMRVFSTKKMPLHDEHGRARYILGIAEDVTERRRSEAAVRDMNSELQQRAAELAAVNRELETYTYTVSHDLHAPLRHISGFTRLVRDRLANYPDVYVHQLFDKIAMATERMSALIDDLLVFSRSSRGALHKEPVHLDGMVRDVVDELAATLAGRDVQWLVRPLPMVLGDAGLLRVVFWNIIGNAAKYTQPRSRAVIEIGTSAQTEREAVLYVRDNGVGFDMSEAHRLFEVFERLHEGREFEGNGIGLATVSRVLERHGGRVWAEGKRDVGATFYLAMPVHHGGAHVVSLPDRC